MQGMTEAKRDKPGTGGFIPSVDIFQYRGEAEGMIAFDTSQGYRHIMKSRVLKVAEA